MPSQIDLDYARQLVQNFRDIQLASGTIRTDDTQAVWFPKDLILEALGLPPDKSGSKVTGLRFYFGSYKSEPGYPRNPFDQDKLTLVMVQTGGDSIEILRGAEKETAYLDSIVDIVPGKTQPSYPTGPSTGLDPLYNDGQMTPPPPQGNVSDLGLYDW